MSQVIRIPSAIYARLEQHAEGFDTPANVIEKLLNHYDGVNHQDLIKSSVSPAAKRDKTQYLFENQTYGKGRLVLAVIKEFVENNPNVSFDELQVVFPKRLQGSIGVVNSIEYVQEKYADKEIKRHFMKPGDLVQVSDNVIVVCTEWGAGNIENFILNAQQNGFEIESITK